MSRSREITAAELRPGMLLFDEDHEEWVDVTAVRHRFRTVMVTIRGGGTEEEQTWPIPADRIVTVED